MKHASGLVRGFMVALAVIGAGVVSGAEAGDTRVTAAELTITALEDQRRSGPELLGYLSAPRAEIRARIVILAAAVSLLVPART